MAKYLVTAAQAETIGKQLLDLIDRKEEIPAAAALIAQLVNLGIRCSPRPTQGTVRLRAVQRATQGMPVKVAMVKRQDLKTGREYNALTVEPIYPDRDGEAIAEDYGADEE